MKAIALICMAVLILASCHKKYTCKPETHVYSFLANKQLDTMRLLTTDTLPYYTFELSAGNSNVFKWYYTFEDCPQIADDEGSRILLFEAPSNVDHFLIDGSLALRQAKCMVYLSCECYPYLPVLIQSGTIEGTRQGTRWEIKVNVQLPWANGGRLTTEQVFVQEK